MSKSKDSNEKSNELRYVMCCSAKNHGRIISLADEVYGITGLISNLKEWMEDAKVSVSDLRHADIFELEESGFKQIAKFVKTKDGGIDLVPTPNSKAIFELSAFGIEGIIRTAFGQKIEFNEVK